MPLRNGIEQCASRKQYCVASIALHCADNGVEGNLIIHCYKNHPIQRKLFIIIAQTLQSLSSLFDERSLSKAAISEDWYLIMQCRGFYQLISHFKFTTFLKGLLHFFLIPLYLISFLNYLLFIYEWKAKTVPSPIFLSNIEVKRDFCLIFHHSWYQEYSIEKREKINCICNIYFCFVLPDRFAFEEEEEEGEWCLNNNFPNNLKILGKRKPWMPKIKCTVVPWINL